MHALQPGIVRRTDPAIGSPQRLGLIEDNLYAINRGDLDCAPVARRPLHPVEECECSGARTTAHIENPNRFIFLKVGDI